MKPQARPFTVEIKRSRRSNSSGTVLTASPLALFDHPLPERRAMNARPDEGSRDASSGAALREAERLFSKSAAMRAAAPLSEGTNRPKNADHQHPSRRDAEATAARPGAETKAGEKRRQGRILPDLLSSAREEERAREAQELMGVRRLPRGTRRPARPEEPQPEERRREERASSGRGRKALVGVQGPKEPVPPAPDVVTLAEQQATVMPVIEQTLLSPKPSGADPRNSGGWFRRKVERTGQATSLGAGERWKRRLPPVCR